MSSRYDEGPELCPLQIAGPFLRRPANALNVEIGAPAQRCRCLTPEDWGAQDLRGVRWLASGGSPLVFGLCTPAVCPMPAGKT